MTRKTMALGVAILAAALGLFVWTGGADHAATVLGHAAVEHPVQESPVRDSALSSSPVHTAPKAEPVEVSLSLIDGRLVVPVETADGQELRFALSTGSDRTVFSESGAARIGTSALGLGGLVVPTARHATVPDADLSAGGSVLDGQISSNFLSDYDMLIDVPGGRLILVPPRGADPFEGLAFSDPIPLRIFHGLVISLDVRVNGAEYPSMLELGAATLVANRGPQSDLTLKDDDTVELGIGSVTFEGIPVGVADLDVFSRWSPTGTGFVLVGTPFLEECVTAVSWVRRELRTCVR